MHLGLIHFASDLIVDSLIHCANSVGRFLTIMINCNSFMSFVPVGVSNVK